MPTLYSGTVLYRQFSPWTGWQWAPAGGEGSLPLLVVCAKHCWEVANLILLAWSPTAWLRSGYQVQLRRLAVVVAVVDVPSPAQRGFVFASCLEQQHCSCVQAATARLVCQEGWQTPHMRYWLRHRGVRDAMNRNWVLKGKCWELLGCIQHLKPLCMYLKVW